MLKFSQAKVKSIENIPVFKVRNLIKKIFLKLLINILSKDGKVLYHGNKSVVILMEKLNKIGQDIQSAFQMMALL